MERRGHKLWLARRFLHLGTACILASGAGLVVLPLLLRSSPVKTASGVSFSRTYRTNGRSWNNAKTFTSLLDDSLDIPSPNLSISACVHLLRLYGPQAEVHIDAEKVRVLSLLTDARVGSRFLGQPAFVPTAFGVRFPEVVKNGALSGLFDEAHRDLSLACFAELGLPTDFPLITASGESIELRLAVTDAIATFHLTQRELEWTTIAFCAYLSDKSWTNRFAEVTTFDTLAKELLRRPLRESSCGGAHRLIALSHLLIADSERHILSAAVRTETVDYLRKILQALQETQSPTGFWTHDWSLLLDDSGSSQIVSRTLDTQSSRLLVTGHLAEWFRMLPADLEVPVTIKSRSRSWLLTQIKQSTRFWDNCCPWTHALCALSD